MVASTAWGSTANVPDLLNLNRNFTESMALSGAVLILEQNSNSGLSVRSPKPFLASPALRKQILSSERLITFQPRLNRVSCSSPRNMLFVYSPSSSDRCNRAANQVCLLVKSCHQKQEPMELRRPKTHPGFHGSWEQSIETQEQVAVRKIAVVQRVVSPFAFDYQKTA